MSGYEPKIPCSLTQAKESWELNTTEKLEQSAIIKEKGTHYFKVAEMSCTLMCIHTSHFNLIVLLEPECVLCAQEGKYKQAAMQYKRIVSWLEHESSMQPEDEEKAKVLRLAAYLNLAMCYLKLHEANTALENCDKVGCKQHFWCLCMVIHTVISKCCKGDYIKLWDLLNVKKWP